MNRTGGDRLFPKLRVEAHTIDLPPRMPTRLPSPQLGGAPDDSVTRRAAMRPRVELAEESQSLQKTQSTGDDGLLRETSVGCPMPMEMHLMPTKGQFAREQASGRAGTDDLNRGFGQSRTYLAGNRGIARKGLNRSDTTLSSGSRGRVSPTSSSRPAPSGRRGRLRGGWWASSRAESLLRSELREGSPRVCPG